MSDIILPVTPFSIYPEARPVPEKLIGVEAALAAAKDPSIEVKPTINKQFSLENKVAFVTGGNSGIGLEYVVALAELGAIVYAIDISTQESEEFLICKEFVKKIGNNAFIDYVTADVTDAESIRAGVQSIVDKHGRLDVAVANAGILGHVVDCHKYPTDVFKRVIDVNVNGAFLTAQAAAKQMLDLKIKGSIIFTASMSGSIINRDMHWVAYTTSKGAVIQLTRALACELGAFDIRVNSISPGHIRTSMTAKLLSEDPQQGNQWAAQNPMSRIGAVYELRGALAYLASDASTYTTGSDLQVDGGHTCW